MTVKNLETASSIHKHSGSEVCRHAIIEIASGESVKRLIVPYERWKEIEKWFYDTDNTSDYVFETDNSGEPHTVVRINRATSEIKFIELTKSKLLSKSLEYILLSNIPAFISFVTTLLLVGFVWAYTAVNAFIRHEKVTSELMEPARIGTLNITLFFLLIYVVIFLAKIFRVLKDKYYAVREDFEISFMSSLALNSFLVAIIGLMGIEGLFEMIISLLL